MDPRKIKPKEEIKLTPCPVCNTPFFVGYNSHEICRECYWHDDYHPVFDGPDDISGANKMSLNEAIANYKKYGICQLHMIEVKEKLKRYMVKKR